MNTGKVDNGEITAMLKGAFCEYGYYEDQPSGWFFGKQVSNETTETNKACFEQFKGLFVTSFDIEVENVVELFIKENEADFTIEDLVSGNPISRRDVDDLTSYVGKKIAQTANAHVLTEEEEMEMAIRLSEKEAENGPELAAKNEEARRVMEQFRKAQEAEDGGVEDNGEAGDFDAETAVAMQLNAKKQEFDAKFDDILNQMQKGSEEVEAEEPMDEDEELERALVASMLQGPVDEVKRKAKDLISDGTFVGETDQAVRESLATDPEAQRVACLQAAEERRLSPSNE